MHFIGVFNKHGGVFRTMDLPHFAARAHQILAAQGQTLEARIVSGDDLEAELERAAADPTCDVLMAGGGDGTVSAAAGICFRSGKPLAVLPGGTMNMFARSLKVPLDLEDALRGIAGGTLRSVDIATANGLPFVHQYSVGLHPRLVRIRNGLGYHGRQGKLLATVRAIGVAVMQPPVFEVEMRTPSGPERLRATGISVSNNLLGEGHVPHADNIDRGVLGVYVARPMPAGELAKLCFSIIIGRWKGNPLVSETEVASISLKFRRLPSTARAVIDGELIALERLVDIRIHPRALKVMSPMMEAEAAA